MKSYISNTLKSLKVNFNKHPEYKGQSMFTNRNIFDNLLLMRDLRLWVIENAPHSINQRKYISQVTKLTHQINYNESLTFGWRAFLFIAFTYYSFLRVGDFSLRRRGTLEINNQPCIRQQTGGTTAVHDYNGKHPIKSAEEKELFFGRDF